MENRSPSRRFPLSESVHATTPINGLAKGIPRRRPEPLPPGLVKRRERYLTRGRTVAEEATENTPRRGGKAAHDAGHLKGVFTCKGRGLREAGWEATEGTTESSILRAVADTHRSYIHLRARRHRRAYSFASRAQAKVQPQRLSRRLQRKQSSAAARSSGNSPC